jgi:hypothetical protein
MRALQVIAAAFALLTLYYARFYVGVRQEAATLVQIAILLAATAVLLAPMRRLTVRINPWLTALVACVLALSVLAWADHDSHSVSDTLNRAVPSLCLITALALRITNQIDRGRLARLD